MSQDDDKDHSYYDMSDAMDEFGSSYGTKGKLIAGLKFLGKVSYNSTKFTFQEVLPAALEHQVRTNEKLLKKGDLTDEQRDRLERFNAEAPNQIESIAEKKEVAKDNAKEKLEADKEREAAASEVRIRNASPVKTEATVDADKSVTEPQKELKKATSTAELPVVSKSPKRSGKTKAIFFVTLLISIFLYVHYQGEKETLVTSADMNSAEIIGNESIKTARGVQILGEPSASISNKTISNVDVSPLMTDSINSGIPAEIEQFQILHEQNRDCGTLDEVYCKSDLLKLAASAAYSNSLRCEHAEDAEREACFSNAGQFIDFEFKKLELEKLRSAKYKLERAIGTKKANHFGIIEKLVEPCKIEALAMGNNKDYWKYTRSTCYPAAEKVYLQPEQDILKKVDARLEEINFNSN